MSQAKDDFRRYLEQRRELGEAGLVLDDADLAEAIRASSRSAPVPRAARPQSGARRRQTPVAKAPSDEPEVAPASVPPASNEPKWSRDAPPVPPDGIRIERADANLFVADPLADKTLAEIVDLISACTKCGLSRGRTNTVPGEGPGDARLMVVGEGPGANEDAQGRPFVGRAGELLDQILAAIDCPRATVYIANVVKCRPPSNRNPERDEIAACLPYLHRQIALIAPSVILAMGSTAALTLLGTRGSLSSLRNKVHHFHGIPLVVTYHPAALLRNPNWKKPTWDDVRIARRLLAGDG